MDFPFAQKSSEFISSGQELPEDITDIGLPKSCLNSFAKEILNKNKVRGDRNIIPMLDKISKLYVTYLSSLGCKICTDSGKKTLNIEHIIEALKQMNFQKHIELLKRDMKSGEKGEKNEDPEDEKKNENTHLKKLINKKKKRGSRRKNFFNKQEKDEIKQQQDELFKSAREELQKEKVKEIMACPNAYGYGYPQNISMQEMDMGIGMRRNYDINNMGINMDMNNMGINMVMGNNGGMNYQMGGGFPMGMVDHAKEEKEGNGEEIRADNKKDNYDEIDKEMFINKNAEDDINFD